jgi:cysteine-rich repeat protein
MAPLSVGLVATLREALAIRPRLFRAAAAFAALGGLVALAIACLPDLALTVAPADSGVVTTAIGSCGDGLIAADPDAGEECDPGEAGVGRGCSADCKIECPPRPVGVVDPESKHCYFSQQALATTFSAATNVCRSSGAHVVTFRDEAEHAFVLGNVARAAKGFWVGLQSKANGYAAVVRPIEPGWMPSCTGCYAPNAPADGGPFPQSSDLTPGDCLADLRTAADGGAYVRVDCGDPLIPIQSQLQVICEREPLGASIELCSGGYCATVSTTRGKKRYLYVPSPVTAEEAKNACAALGGYLVLFDSAEEREALLSQVRLVVQPGEQSAWIGLASSGDAGPGAYVWDDGDSETQRPLVWGAGEPNRAGRAAALLPSAPDQAPPIDNDVQLARAASPTERHPYLCQYQ